MIIDFSSHIILREAEGKLASKKDFMLIKKNFESETSDHKAKILGGNAKRLLKI